MAIAMFIGGETGDLAEVTATGTVAISSTTFRSGAYSYRTNPTTTGTGSFVALNGGLGTNQLSSRFYIQPSVLPSSAGTDEPIVALTLGSNTPLELRVTDGGVLKLYSGGTVLQATGTAVLSTTTFARIQISIDVGANPWLVKVWVNGTLDINASIALVSTTIFSLLTYGKSTNRNGNTVDFFFDDICEDPTVTQVPDGKVIARQIAANGNYNAWTYSTGTLLSGVLDHTPNGANVANVNTATAANKFSGTVDFTLTGGTGSTGHGNETVGASDTINAFKIGAFGNTASTGSDGADSVIFRTGGVDALKAISSWSAAVAPGTYHHALNTATPTAAQVRSCEVGDSKGTGTKLHSVYAMWAMVDYLPVVVNQPSRPEDFRRAFTTNAFARYRANVSSRPPFKFKSLKSNRVTKVVQPPAAKLGLQPSEIFRAKSNIQFQGYRIRVSSRSPFRSALGKLRKLIPFIQPPAAKLGIVLKYIHRTRITSLAKLPRFLRRYSMRRVFLSFPTGLPIRIIHRVRKTAGNAGAKILRVYPLRQLTKLAQPPVAKLGVWLRVIHHPRITPLSKPFRSFRVFVLKKLKLSFPTGLPMRLAHRTKKVGTGPRFKGLRVNPIHLLRLVQPPSAKLGIWLRTIHRPRIFRARIVTPLSRVFSLRRLKLSFPTGLPLRIVHRVRKVIAGPRFKGLRVNPIRLVKLWSPIFNAGIPVRIVHKPKLVLGSKPIRVFRRFSMRLLRLVQPPASALGIWIRVIRRTRITGPSKPFRSLRRFPLKLLKLVQPPASALGVWLRTIHRPRIFRANIVGPLRRIFALKRLKPLSFPTGLPIRLVHRVKKTAAGIRFRALRVQPFRLLRLIQPPALELAFLLKTIHKPRITLRSKPFVSLRRFSRKLLRLVQPPAVNLGILLKTLHRPRIFRIKIGPSLARISTLVRWRKLFSLVPTGLPIRLVHRVRQVAANARFKGLKVNPIHLLRLVQPSAAKLGIWLRTIHRPRITLLSKKPRFLQHFIIRLARLFTPPFVPAPPIKIVHRVRKTAAGFKIRILQIHPLHLLRLIQPPAAKLGLLPSQIFLARYEIFRLAYQKRVLNRAPFRSLRRYVMQLLRKIQPPAAKLGLLPRQIFLARYALLRTIYVKNLLARPPFRSLRRYVMILLRKIQPPAAKLGVLLKTLHRPRLLLVAKQPRFLRRYVMNLLRKIQPPASALGMVLKYVHHTRITPLGPKIRNLRTFPMKLLRLMQPPVARLGILFKGIHRPRLILRAKPALILRRFPIHLLRLVQPPVAKLGVWLRTIHHPRVTSRSRLFPVLRRFPMKLLRLILPPPFGLPIKFIHRVRKTAASPKMRNLRVFPIRLLRLIQPPVARLGILFKGIHRPRVILPAKPLRILRRFPIRLLRLVQPPAAKLAFLLKTIHRPRSLGPSAKPIFIRRYIMRLARLIPPAGRAIALPREIFKPRIFKAKIGPSLARISALVRWKRLFSLIPTGIPIRVAHHVRRLATGPRFKMFRVYPLRRVRMTVPAAAGLAVLPRQIFRHYVLKTKIGPSLARIGALVRWRRYLSRIDLNKFPLRIVHRVRVLRTKLPAPLPINLRVVRFARIAEHPLIHKILTLLAILQNKVSLLLALQNQVNLVMPLTETVVVVAPETKQITLVAPLVKQVNLTMPIDP